MVRLRGSLDPKLLPVMLIVGIWLPGINGKLVLILTPFTGVPFIE
jgi:hypothetical protein